MKTYLTRRETCQTGTRGHLPETESGGANTCFHLKLNRKNKKGWEKHQGESIRQAENVLLTFFVELPKEDALPVHR